MNALGLDIRNQLPYQNKKEVLVEDHDTHDIIKWIGKIHPMVAKQYDDIAELHWKGNVEDTARHLFDFCKKNIRYKVEGPDDQTIKKPGAILNHGYGDCKHYASYINGVCCSLQRKGYPIKSKYRFTADRPGMEVHHVFAVVSEPSSIGYPSKAKQWGADKIRDYAKENGLRLVHGYEVEGRSYVSGTNQEFWVDPVLDTFNRRPTYHNVKEKDMSLSLISGTSHYSGDDSSIGKKHHNIFKDIAHGMQVNLQNIKHGADVAVHDTGKGIKYAVKDTGKGIKIAAEQVKHVVLKVAAAPARNSFLALVDFNMFNLAKHLYDALNSNRAGALLNKWKDLGGDPNKLKSAVNNGIRNYNKHHSKKITGRSIDDAVNFYQSHTFPWHHSHIPHQIHNGRKLYFMRGTYIGCSCNTNSIGCQGNSVGCLPACAPAAIALATAIIAALKSFLNLSADEDKEMTEAAKNGAKNLITDSSQGIDIANGDQGPAAAAALNTLTDPTAQGTTAPSMKVSTGIGPDGAPTLAVHDVDHPIINQAGQPIKDDQGPAAPPAFSNTLDNIKVHVKQFWNDYKVPVLIGTAGVIAFKSKRVRKTLGIK